MSVTDRIQCGLHESVMLIEKKFCTFPWTGYAHLFWKNYNLEDAFLLPMRPSIQNEIQKACCIVVSPLPGFLLNDAVLWTTDPGYL
jgi:hypothetical protein